MKVRNANGNFENAVEILMPEGVADVADGSVTRAKLDTNVGDAVDNIGSIVEYGPSNFFDPSLFARLNYYYDFKDGYTQVSAAAGVWLVETMIPVESTSLYVTVEPDYYPTIAQYSSLLLVYCYNASGNYLGRINTRFANFELDNSHYFVLPTGTTQIRLYSNAGESLLQPDKIALSTVPLDQFLYYGEHADPIVKKTALPFKVDDLVDTKVLPLFGKTIVNFGDSIFGNKRPPDDVSTSLATITGATVYNLGFGGCRMAPHPTKWASPFCMHALAHAVATGDYSTQLNVSLTGAPAYYEESRTLLASLDFSKVDIVTIAYGTNDFTGEILLDNPDNPKDINTFGGALRYSLEELLGAFPHLHIFVCTPTYRFWMDSENDYAFVTDSDEKVNDDTGLKLTDYVAKMKEIAQEYHIKCIDNYYELGINKYNRAYWFPSTDGTHHNKLGGMLIAQHMANEIF